MSDPSVLIWSGADPGSWLIDWTQTGTWTVVVPSDPPAIDWRTGLDTGVPPALPADVQAWAAQECPGCGPWTPLWAAPVAGLLAVWLLAMVLVRRRRMQ